MRNSQLPPLPPGTPYATHIDVLSRKEFLEYFGQQYGAGQHVTLLGPTQRGKTRLSHEMLQYVISPDGIKVIMLAGKPPGRDPVMSAAPDKLNLRRVEEWPPNWNFRDRNRSGYVLQPRHNMEDLRADNAHVGHHFRKAMIDCYRSDPKHPVILDVDETHHVQNEYKLKSELEAPLMRGAPVCGVWCKIQRGRYISYHAYSEAAWVIIFYDPDRDNQKRYADIGGVDPDFILQVVSGLKTRTGDDGKSTISEAMCIRRSGPECFIIGMD